MGFHERGAKMVPGGAGSGGWGWREAQGGAQEDLPRAEEGGGDQSLTQPPGRLPTAHHMQGRWLGRSNPAVLSVLCGVRPKIMEAYAPSQLSVLWCRRRQQRLRGGEDRLQLRRLFLYLLRHWRTRKEEQKQTLTRQGGDLESFRLGAGPRGTSSRLPSSRGVRG